GIQMCEFLERERVEVCEKRVLELGAGSGLVSILAARLGACVTVTDLPQVLPHTIRNINSNMPLTGWPSEPPAVLPLLWGRDLERFSSQWDLVLGSDIVYIPETFPLLLHTLVHLSKSGAVVYLSSKMRREHGAHEFYHTLLPQSFHVELVHRDAKKNINIYRAMLIRTQEPCVCAHVCRKPWFVVLRANQIAGFKIPKLVEVELMELWEGRETDLSPCDKYGRFPRWSSSTHAHIREPITRATAGSRTIKNRVNWTPEFGLCSEYTGHEMEKQSALMKRQSERREKEMVQSEDSRNHWQPSSTHYRTERDEDVFRAKSYGELEEWARRWCYNHSLLRRRRLQGEMWSEIQNTLKTERTSASTSRSFSTEPGVNISENKSHQLPPPYSSVKHETSGKMLKEQAQRTGLSSGWNQPPNYTPPPPYTSPPNTHTLTGTLEPHGAFPCLRTEYRSGGGPHDPIQIDHCSVSSSDRRGHLQFSSGDRTPGTLSSPGSGRTQHQQELWSSVHQQVNQQVFTPQSSGHEEKYQTSYSDITLTKPRRRRRSEGTVFCLVSHMGKFTGLSDEPLKCQTVRLLKSSTFAENQLADEADSLGTFTQNATLKEEPREEHQDQRDQNVRIHKLVKELRNEREELRKRSTEKRSAIGLNKNKHEDTDSNKEKDHVTPAVSSKSSTLEVPHHQTILRFPLWMEPKCSKNKTNRSREVQYEQSEPRKNTMNNEKTGLVAIDATCVVIKVEFLEPPEKEHVQYMSSCPTDPSKQRSDSIQDHETTEQATDRRSEVKIINQTKQRSSEIQAKHEMLKERAERILGIVLQDSFNEAYITQKENSRIQQVHDASEGTDDHESESLLKAECENVEIPKTATPNEEAALSSMSEAEAMLESSEVTHRDDENIRTGHEVMALMSMKQDGELKSGDRKFILDEKIPRVIGIKENQVKDSAEGSPSGETMQNLNQSLQRNSSETFSHKSKRSEDDLVHETDKRRVLLSRSLKNASEPFSQEDEGNSSKFQREDHDEDISLLAERGEAVLLNSYERDTDKVLDQGRKPTDENSSITIHNLQRTGEMFGLEGGHYQENLLNLLNLQSTSESLQQESRPDRNLSCSGDPQVCFGHHVENTNETLAPEVTPRGEHLSDVWPNLLDSSVINFSEKDILREDRPSHTIHDANHLHQTLPGHSMEKTSESRDLEDVHGEGNFSSDVIHLHPFFSARDIRKSLDEQSFLHEDGEETLSSSSQTDIPLDDLQNLFGGSVEDTSELIEQEGNEAIASPSSDLQALSTEELTSSLLSPPHAEISPHPPDHLSSTLLSPPLSAAGSSPSRLSDSLSEISSVHAQACSSALTTALNSNRGKACPRSLWDAMSRIRRHTAPDSETEEDEGEVWEPVEPREDNLSENTGIKDEESALEEMSGRAGVHLQDVRRPAAGMKHEADDSLSSSSVDSLDTIIEGEGRRSILETDEEDEKIQESDLFSEKEE
ncbi:hypothetical protein QTP86_029303, partial [Hemibagrus guttatus]